MKETFVKNLKKTLIIVAVFLAIAFGVIIIMYNSDPAGFPDKLEKYAKELTATISELYGDKEEIALPEKESLEKAQKHYYFQQLDYSGKIIYVTIEKSIDKFLNGEEEIVLPTELKKIAKESGTGAVEKSFQDAWDAFMLDKSDYFYLDSSKSCIRTEIRNYWLFKDYRFSIGKEKNTTYFKEGTYSKEQIEQRQKELDRVADKIVNAANGSDYEKIKYVHDYLIEHTEYGDVNGKEVSDVYGCLVKGEAICEGYARAFKYLLDKMDIPCILVAGDAVDDEGHSEAHAWNYVYIDNNWYAVDTTWDDPSIVGNVTITNEIKYRYFLKGKYTMKKDHTCDGQITKDGKSFEYPELATDDYKIKD